MAALTEEQVRSLLGLIAGAQPDALDCDGCFELMAEFADARLAERSLPEAMRAVEAHLGQCECCQYEYEMLLEGLRELAG